MKLQRNIVYNEDCLSGLKDIESGTVDLVVTDPPYDVNYGKKSEYLSQIGKARDKQIERDKEFIDVFKDYEPLCLELYRILKDDTHCYVFCGASQIKLYSEFMVKAGFKEPQVLVWRKRNTTFDMTFGHKFPSNSEFLLFFHKGWRKLNGYKVERDLFRTVLEFDSNGDTDTHSCAKPIDLIMFLTKLSSNEGDLCVDPFSGGGSHLVAFKRLNRDFIGFEISTVYYKSILRKLEIEKTQVKLEDWSETNE